MKLEISKMLTISTVHISEETAKKMDITVENGELPLSVYRKERYGWWIYLTPGISNNNYLPNDLKDCITLAAENHCQWLCIDCDGRVVPGLKKYEHSWGDC